MPDFNTLFDRPVIILAAPRSGSTLLFETLAEAPEVWTVGGESHQFIEGLKPLNPMSGMVDSNRLTEQHASQQIIGMLRMRFARYLRDRNGREFFRNQHIPQVRFLEKTPKNALRQPFLENVFPGALYIYLYRDPRQNISSMIEAWKAGRWVTYPRLPGWQGPPWSLLLPPEWKQLNGRSLAEICAFQWAKTNEIIIEDLQKLSPERWISVNYSDFLASTESEVTRLCNFAQWEVDDHLRRRVTSPLPLSRFTHTQPDPDKWRKNEDVIMPLMEQLRPTWAQCQATKIS